MTDLVFVKPPPQGLLLNNAKGHPIRGGKVLQLAEGHPVKQQLTWQLSNSSGDGSCDPGNVWLTRNPVVQKSLGSDSSLLALGGLHMREAGR